jgi:hypothetical protein
VAKRLDDLAIRLACPHSHATPVLGKAIERCHQRSAASAAALALMSSSAQPPAAPPSTEPATAATGAMATTSAAPHNISKPSPMSLPSPRPTVTVLVPYDQAASHPGAGTLTIDHAVPESCVEALLQLWRSLPTAPKEKASPIDRAYYADVDSLLARLIDDALVETGLLERPHHGAAAATQTLMRFLHYPTVGGFLPAHVDLPRATADGARTTHTFLLYLTDCAAGGETLLLDAKPGDAKLVHQGGVVHGERATLARSAPRRGRLLLMPHACPHSAAETVSVPKTLIRGEVLLPSVTPPHHSHLEHLECRL